MSLTPGAYDPRFMKPATLCRCGHILECCSDCRGWLLEHSLRIESGWRWYINHVPYGVYGVAGTVAADAAEADDLAFFLSVR